MELLRQMAQGFSHLLFPRLCEGCRKPLVKSEYIICLNCELFLSRTGYHHIPDNETALRLSGRIAFNHATSVFYFNDKSLIQHLIHGLKYGEKKENGIYLGRELGKAIEPLQWRIDMLIPVPLHPKKQAGRGYNQSSLIAAGMAQILKVPVQEHNLIRIRNTSSQTDKSRAERIANVSRAFDLRFPSKIKNKHVLLLDDVLTTGATLEACASALLQHPGTTVSIATVAIAAN